MSLTKRSAERLGVDINNLGPGCTDAEDERAHEENKRAHREAAEGIAHRKITAILKLRDQIDELCEEVSVAAGFKTPLSERAQDAWTFFEAGFDLLQFPPRADADKEPFR